MPGAMVRNGRKRAHTHTHQNRTELYSITLDLGNSSKRTAQRGVCTETGVAPLMKTPSRERSAGYSNKVGVSDGSMLFLLSDLNNASIQCRNILAWYASRPEASAALLVPHAFLLRPSCHLG
eukprot:1158634-Pelagomonas_calceolata.AAC.5